MTSINKVDDISRDDKHSSDDREDTGDQKSVVRKDVTNQEPLSPAQYRKGRKVQMSITRNSRTIPGVFVVQDIRADGGLWQYQLKEEEANRIYRNAAGNVWFREDDLEFYEE